MNGATWIPGISAWHAGRRQRALVHLVGVLGLVALAIGLTPRVAELWRPPRADVVLATVLLYVLPVLAAVLTRHDASRFDRAQGGAWQRLLANRIAMTGALVVAGLAVAAVLAPLLTRYDPIDFGDISQMRFRAPSPAHALGTDGFGRDVLARVLYGARVSLAVGFLAATLTVGIGTAVGLLSGYLGRWVDAVLMRTSDLLIAFPRIFLVLLIISLAEPSIWLVIVVLGSTGWMGTARLVRAQVLSLREMDFVQAARALGLPVWRILLRHVLPNTLAPVVVSATLTVGNAILAESVLSFLGLGVQVPTPSWGAMIEDGRRVFPNVWWLATFPGLAITLTVVGFNLLGDGLRDAFDPQLKD